MNGAPEFLASEPSLLSVLLRMGTSLLLVLGLALLAIYVLKHFYRPTRSGSSAFQVLSRISLGGRQSLYMVKVAEKALVLGVSDTAITRLLVMKATDVPMENQQTPTPIKNFAEVFAEKIRGTWSKREI